MMRALQLCVWTLVCASACTTQSSEVVLGPEPPLPPPEAPASSSGAASPPPSGTEAHDASADAALEPDAALDAAGPAAGTRSPLPAAVRAEMTGVSWHDGCPVALDALALLDVPYWDFAGNPQRGELVVAAAVADGVLAAFATLAAQHVPIARMRRIDAYAGDDDLSMADDNTSAFNCRKVTGGSAWSAHSYGTAIDVNPRENPYVKGQSVFPPEGAEYLDRTDVRPGMATEGSALVGAFDALGWGWGGRWVSLKDYQHFSADNR